jgi:hypothetical protein
MSEGAESQHPTAAASRLPSTSDENPRAGRLDSYIPLFSKLVWPALIIGALLAYHGRIDSILCHVDDAISRGQPVEIGNYFKLGEAISVEQLHNFAPADVGKDIDLTKVGGYSAFTEKGSSALLDQLHKQLQNDPKGKTIDLLLLTSGGQYSAELLRRYILELGIRFVLFTDNEKFDSWIEAPLFSAQLPRSDPGADKMLSYKDLLGGTIGRRTDRVPAATSAVDTLKTMESERLANIAVVDDANKFKFIASRDGIVAKLFVESLATKPYAPPCKPADQPEKS